MNLEQYSRCLYYALSSIRARGKQVIPNDDTNPSLFYFLLGLPSFLLRFLAHPTLLVLAHFLLTCWQRLRFFGCCSIDSVFFLETNMKLPTQQNWYHLSHFVDLNDSDIFFPATMDYWILSSCWNYFPWNCTTAFFRDHQICFCKAKWLYSFLCNLLVLCFAAISYHSISRLNYDLSTLVVDCYLLAYFHLSHFLFNLHWVHCFQHPFAILHYFHFIRYYCLHSQSQVSYLLHLIHCFQWLIVPLLASNLNSISFQSHFDQFSILLGLGYFQCWNSITFLTFFLW